VPLKSARERRDEARRIIAASVDPGEQKQAERTVQEATCETVAREWLALKASTLDARAADRQRQLKTGADDN
jgi:hypothetical protein